MISATNSPVSEMQMCKPTSLPMRARTIKDASTSFRPGVEGLVRQPAHQLLPPRPLLLRAITLLILKTPVLPLQMAKAGAIVGIAQGTLCSRVANLVHGLRYLLQRALTVPQRPLQRRHPLALFLMDARMRQHQMDVQSPAPRSYSHFS